MIAEAPLKNHLDGRLVVNYLRERRIDVSGSALGEADAKVVRNWGQRGGITKVFTVDRILTKLDIHIDELPDEVWSDPPFGHPEEFRRRVLDRILTEPVKQVARDEGIAPSTIRTWRGAAA